MRKGLFCFIIVILFSSISCYNVTLGTDEIVCTRSSDGIICNGETFSPQEEVIEPGSGEFWGFVFISIGLVLFGGMMSGLTIGLMSLDQISLEVVKNGGDPKERKYAERIIPVIKRHHLLLVTLLLSNAAAMEALPIFLDRISSPIAAILISVTMVLFFGEIIPQSICHRFGLAVGANLAWLVQILMIILWPIAFPISKILDFLLGHDHKDYFRRGELRALVSIHGEDQKGPLTIDETTIIQGALDMKHKTLKNCMNPLDDIFMLDINARMDKKTMKEVKEQGHSRIPVYVGKRSNVQSLLLVKSLLFVNFDDAPPVGDLELRDLPKYPETQDLYDTLNMFQTGRSHMACVYSVENKDVIGIVTLEDIIEELIQEEIMDEADLAYEYTKKAEKLMKQAEALRRGISLDKVKRRERRARVSHHKSHSTGGQIVRSASSEELKSMKSAENVVKLMTDEELSADHMSLRLSAPTTPVLHTKDEDFV